MRTTTIFAETHTSERANHVAYRLVFLLITDLLTFKAISFDFSQFFSLEILPDINFCEVLKQVFLDTKTTVTSAILNTSLTSDHCNIFLVVKMFGHHLQCSTNFICLTPNWGRAYDIHQDHLQWKASHKTRPSWSFDLAKWRIKVTVLVNYINIPFIQLLAH